MKKLPYWFLMFSLLFCSTTALADDHDEDDAERETLSEKAVMAFLDENGLDHLKKQLKETREEEPDEFIELLEEYSERIQDLKELAKENPELAKAILLAEKLEAKSLHIAEAIEKTEDPAKRKALNNDLKGVLEKIFDARMVEGKTELKHLETEIAELRAEINKREENKERIIQARMRDLTEDDNHDWW